MASAITLAPTTGRDEIDFGDRRAPSAALRPRRSSGAVPPRPALKMARSIGVAASAAASCAAKPAVSRRSKIWLWTSAPSARHARAPRQDARSSRPHNRSVTPARAWHSRQGGADAAGRAGNQDGFLPHGSRWPPHQCGKCFLPNRASRGYGAAPFTKGIQALERANGRVRGNCPGTEQSRLARLPSSALRIYARRSPIGWRRCCWSGVFTSIPSTIPISSMPRPNSSSPVARARWWAASPPRSTGCIRNAITTPPAISASSRRSTTRRCSTRC